MSSCAGDTSEAVTSLEVIEVINGIADVERLREVMRALDELTAATPTEVEAQDWMPRETASKWLSRLAVRDWVRKREHDGRYKLTLAGEFTLQSYMSCVETIDQESLAYLTRSKGRIQWLLACKAGPTRPADLTTSDDHSASDRNRHELDEQGWIRRERGTYVLTPVGGCVLSAYSELAERIGQVIEKSALLVRAGTWANDLPLRSLAEARLTATRPGQPFATLTVFYNLCDPTLTHLRVLIPFFYPRLFDAYDLLVQGGLQTEVILDASVYDKLRRNEADTGHLLDHAERENCSIFRLEESIDFGVALYDDRKVAAGPYAKDDPTHTLLVSSNEALVEWGTDVYETYCEKAKPITNYFPPRH